MTIDPLSEWLRSQLVLIGSVRRTRPSPSRLVRSFARHGAGPRLRKFDIKRQVPPPIALRRPSVLAWSDGRPPSPAVRFIALRGLERDARIEAGEARAEDQGTVGRVVEEDPVAETPNALKVVAGILCIAWAVFWFTFGWFIMPILNVMLGAAGVGLLALATRYKKPISPEERERRRQWYQQGW